MPQSHPALSKQSCGAWSTRFRMSGSVLPFRLDSAVETPIPRYRQSTRTNLFGSMVPRAAFVIGIQLLLVNPTIMAVAVSSTFALGALARTHQQAYATEYCAEMWSGPGRGGGMWNDRSCSDQLPFVCSLQPSGGMDLINFLFLYIRVSISPLGVDYSLEYLSYFARSMVWD